MSTLYTTTYPYEKTLQRYETDNILITSNHMDKVGNWSGTGGYVEDVIFDNISGVSSGTYGPGTEWQVSHEFKNNLKAKVKTAHVRLVEGSHQDDDSIKIYYVDYYTKEKVLIYSYAWRSVGAGTIKNFDIGLPEGVTVSQMIVETILRGTIQHITYDYELDKTSQLVKNKVEHVIMQNELFQKVTSNAEIIGD